MYGGVQESSTAVRSGSTNSTDPRVTRSKALIVEAAMAEFLDQGYAATRLEDVAERAGISKRTIYNLYSGKEEVFREVLQLALDRAASFATDVVATLGRSDEIASELNSAASQLAAAVVDDRIVSLRRLLIGEAHRFPELASEYYRRVPGSVLEALALALARYAGRGALAVEDSGLAAEHFAYLVLGASLDQAMFGFGPRTAVELDERARAGVTAYLRAYAA